MDFHIHRPSPMVTRHRGATTPSTAAAPSAAMCISPFTQTAGKSYGSLLKGKSLLLDLVNDKDRLRIEAEVKAMGGTIVDYFQDDKPPYLVISDHAIAAKLEKMKLQNGISLDATALKRLPMILKQAVQNRVRVRTYPSFSCMLENCKAKFKKNLRQPQVPTPRMQTGGPLPSFLFKSPKKGRQNSIKTRQLQKPYIKFEDLNQQFQPCCKELTSANNYNTVYFGKYFGQSLFHKANSEQEAKRERELEQEKNEDYQPPSKRKGQVKKNNKGYCEVCSVHCDNMKMHFNSKQHQTSISQPGMYDELDQMLGSYVDHITCPRMPPLRRQSSSSMPSSSDSCSDYPYSSRFY